MQLPHLEIGVLDFTIVLADVLRFYVTMRPLKFLSCIQKPYG